MDISEIREYLTRRGKQCGETVDAYYEHVPYLLELVDKIQKEYEGYRQEAQQYMRGKRQLQQRVRELESQAVKDSDELKIVEGYVYRYQERVKELEDQEAQKKEIYQRLAEHYPDGAPHFCTEWDGLFICPGDAEWEACVCYK